MVRTAPASTPHKPSLEFVPGFPSCQILQSSAMFTPGDRHLVKGKGNGQVRKSGLDPPPPAPPAQRGDLSHAPPLES